MSRPLRIEYAGALYHVTSRGDGREDIFLDDEDRILFLSVLAEAVEILNWSVHSYCLMGNHYHLLLETPDSNLAKGMRHLNGVYTQRFNRKHKRVGHVFQEEADKELGMALHAVMDFTSPVHENFQKWVFFDINGWWPGNWFDTPRSHGNHSKEDKSHLEMNSELIEKTLTLMNMAMKKDLSFVNCEQYKNSCNE